MATEMATGTLEEIPLPNLYLQIEYATSAFAILGISDQPTELEIRESYRALALRLHPDKAPEDSLRQLHTSLFQKVQAAYDQVLRGCTDDAANGRKAQRHRLPETWESLHARNVAFKEALRSERERAIQAKRIAADQEALRQANLKAKNARLAERRGTRGQALQREQGAIRIMMEN